MFEVTLTTAERVKITVNPYPAGSRLDGPVIATPEDGATFGAKVEQVDDNTIILDAGNVAGDVIYDLKADVDLGPGVETITEQVVLHCNNPKAQQLGLAIGEILPKGTSSTVSPVPTQPYTGLADASTKPAPVEPK